MAEHHVNIWDMKVTYTLPEIDDTMQARAEAIIREMMQPPDLSFWGGGPAFAPECDCRGIVHTCNKIT